MKENGVLDYQTSGGLSGSLDRGVLSNLALCLKFKINAKFEGLACYQAVSYDNKPLQLAPEWNSSKCPHFALIIEISSTRGSHRPMRTAATDFLFLI